MPSPLLIIVGTTASGKERLALDCARLLDAEIVSVDSMKVYRTLDIATAKAGAAERALVPHHCLDLADPDQRFSAADFVAAADAAIASIHARGKRAILSGGTALYYKALLDGLFEGPGADPAHRAHLERRAESEGSKSLHRELSARDPSAAEKIHPSDLRRIVRALEVLHLTGEAISARQRQWTDAYFSTPRHPFRMVRIVRDRDDVHARIRQRVERMASSGLREEAERVFAMRSTLSITPLQAVGYKEFFPHFLGEESWPEALDRLCRATNKLVRKQDTWFRKFPALEIPLTPESDPLQTAAAVAHHFSHPATPQPHPLSLEGEG